MSVTETDRRKPREQQAQEGCRIWREEDFLWAAATYRRVGEKYLARTLIEHSRLWRLKRIILEEERLNGCPTQMVHGGKHPGLNHSGSSDPKQGRALAKPDDTPRAKPDPAAL